MSRRELQAMWENYLAEVGAEGDREALPRAVWREAVVVALQRKLSLTERRLRVLAVEAAWFARA